ncbi:hypothetical protein PRIPAC_79283 [Pristionchus pacificus]|uniref:Uncharacterized protein n=1 Tax=Pristionchus pacificus TaxID=54126 RepID=A0A2A6C3W9_PRIPA|nr:hypothetical protein PRIPAC_79283 [Pristionchus pacificus]|eukprot:PDM72816.1 hypothetical protein PRIPAC_39250 [Pristionchus pacificus]
MVYVLLHFNRSFTDQYSPIFEIFTALEFRIFLCHFVMQGMIGMSARIVVMYQQYFGTQLHAQSIPLIFASLSHVAMYSFFCGTYEKMSPASIIIVILTEGTNLILSWCAAWALIFEYVTVRQLLIMFVCLGGVGGLVFAGTISYNKNLIKHLKAGAQINRYSIAFAYQIRENLVALRAVLGLVKRIVLLNIPLLSIQFFIRYVSSSHREIHANFSFAFFDIIISVYPLIIASYVPFSDPIFEQSLLRLPFGRNVFSILTVIYGKRHTKKTSIILIKDNDVYFKMFNNAIDSRR